MKSPKLFKRQRKPNPSDVLNISVIARRKSKDDEIPKDTYNAEIVVKKDASISGNAPCSFIIKFGTSNGDAGSANVSMLKDGSIKVTL